MMFRLLRQTELLTYVSAVRRFEWIIEGKHATVQTQGEMIMDKLQISATFIDLVFLFLLAVWSVLSRIYA